MSISAQDVRDYLVLNTDSTSRYSNARITSNINAALEFLERATHRYFSPRSGVTLSITTNGDATVDLPGVRTVTSVTQAGTTLTLNETYWLSPDAQQTGVYTGMTLRPFATRGGDWWLAIPQWFDRNLDSPYYPGNAGYGSLPNDLQVVADVGYVDPVAEVPSFGIAWLVMAAWYTKRPDAVLTGSTQTPGGNVIPLEELPSEVALFIEGWKIGSHMAVSV